VPDPCAVEAKLAQIEAEMRRTGLWDMPAPDAGALAFRQAFASDTMIFEQWLRWVFVVRVRERLADGALPPSSFVGAQAARELDGRREHGRLVELLADFDALFR